jgi:hypothetical protein
VPAETVIEAAPENPATLTLDEIGARLLAAQNSRSKAATGGQVVEHLLGRVPDSPITDPWPTQSAIAGVMQVTRARIGQIVGTLFSKASKDVAVTVLRDEIVAMVDAQGGVATAEELADQLALPLKADELRRRELSRDILPHVRDFYAGYLDGEVREPFYAPSSRT